MAESIAKVLSVTVRVPVLKRAPPCPSPPGGNVMGIKMMPNGAVS
jgi:hypothetical protein